MIAGNAMNPIQSAVRIIPRSRFFACPRIHHAIIAPGTARVPCRHNFQHLCKAAAGDASPSGDGRQAEPTQSGEWRTISLPFGVPTAGSVFFLAGFLKLLIMCFPYAPISVAMYLTGRADLGYVAVLKMMPIALGLLALAKYLVDSGLHERPRVRWGIIGSGILALVLSRVLFAGPKPNHVLNPSLRAARQARMAQISEQQEEMSRRQEARQSALKTPEEAKHFMQAREEQAHLAQHLAQQQQQQRRQQQEQQ